MAIDWNKTASITQIAQTGIVFISIIIIWYQLKQQTKLTRSANIQTLFELASPLSIQVMQDRTLAKLIYEGHKEYEDFDEVDKFRYRATLIWRLTFQENIYYQKQSGLLEDNVYQAWNDDFKVWAERRHLKLRWPELGQYYHPDFRSYVDKTLDTANLTCAQHLIEPERE
jgi:hypothetical protein